MMTEHKRISQRRSNENLAAKASGSKQCKLPTTSGRTPEIDRLVELVNTSDALRPESVLRRIKAVCSK